MDLLPSKKSEIIIESDDGEFSPERDIRFLHVAGKTLT
jgi:hypothetical protein